MSKFKIEKRNSRSSQRSNSSKVKLVVIALAVVLVVVALASVLSVKPAKPSGKPATQTVTPDLASNIIDENGAKIGTAIVVRNGDTYTERFEIAQQEVDKLTNAETLGSYFSDLLNSDGERIEFDALVDSERIVNPVVAEFDSICGCLDLEPTTSNTSTFLFKTAFEENQPIIVLIGEATLQEDGTVLTSWTQVPATILSNGAIEVAFLYEQVYQIANTIGLITVISGDIPPIKELAFEFVSATDAAGNSITPTFVFEWTETREPAIQLSEQLSELSLIDYKPELAEQFRDFQISIGAPEDVDISRYTTILPQSVQEIGYEEPFGDLLITCAPVESLPSLTPGLQLCVFLVYFDGNQLEDGSYASNWRSTVGEINEEGQLVLTISQELMLMFAESADVAIVMVYLNGSNNGDHSGGLDSR